jgi:uncharacterized protein YbjT (DUF2867 family)
MIPSTSPITVLGASGKTGRRVVSRLRARGAEARAGSRSGAPPFDWEQPSGWPAIFEGASAAYVSYYPDLAAPGAPEAVGALFDVAVAAGVSRIVLLSGRGEEAAQRSEEVLAASGADWTVVRASWFNQNFSEGAFAGLLAGGSLALPVGDDVREPFVDADDIADVAVAALTEDGHENRIYEVTGPRLLTFAEAVSEIASAAGRALRYTPISFDAFAAGLAGSGVPEGETALLRYLFSEVLDGRNACTTGGVEEALGRGARDFTSFAVEAASAGAWSPVNASAA